MTNVPSSVQLKDEPAKRFDALKVRYDLLPADGIHALAEHYTRGAIKYEDRNWEKGMAWTRCWGPLLRHAFAWFRGEDLDPETNTHHMIAVAWNALALYCYARRNVGTDDRPSLTPVPKSFIEGDCYVITNDKNRIPFVATYINYHFTPWGLERDRSMYIPTSAAVVHSHLGRLDIS